ncbi:hypothetical protein TorRG33x02_290990 [Trema orientale]|uniref:Uncharacterized protein n=1 Tax=Trema orientale TaxID=63057 RepID=A0A2P5CBU6_TREOI|nr:hypothetical protein TorRG33x02_290990 [Trema orientale]
MEITLSVIVGSNSSKTPSMRPEDMLQEPKESPATRGKPLATRGHVTRPEEKPCNPRLCRNTRGEVLRPEVASQEPRGSLAIPSRAARPEVLA